jgi:hypothetical protein
MRISKNKRKQVDENEFIMNRNNTINIDDTS